MSVMEIPWNLEGTTPNDGNARENRLEMELRNRASSNNENSQWWERTRGTTREERSVVERCRLGSSQESSETRSRGAEAEFEGKKKK